MRICVIGAGFTGLSAAMELAEGGHQVVVLEKDSEVGGLAGSFSLDGTKLEKYYHHWFTSDQYLLEVVKKLGCEDKLVVRDTATGMHYANRFFRLSSPSDLLKFSPLSFSGRLRLGLAFLATRRVQNWRELESLTAEEWLLRTFGEEVYRVVWHPLLVGKFGEYSGEVSAVWFWNKLRLRGGSRGRGGHEKLMYYRGGFAALSENMAEFAESHGAVIRRNTAARGLIIDRGRIAGVESSAGLITVDAVVITTPLPIAADLLRTHVSDEYEASLRRIRYLSNLCLVLQLDRSLSSLYWLNVNDPSFPFVGVIEHTNFEPQTTYGGKHIVYLSKYLPPSAPMYKMSDSELLDYSLPFLKKMFPQFHREWIRGFSVWRADYSQPVIERFYSLLVPARETPLKNVYLTTMAQVYPEDRGTNYAIRGGSECARHIIATSKSNF